MGEAPVGLYHGGLEGTHIISTHAPLLRTSYDCISVQGVVEHTPSGAVASHSQLCPRRGVRTDHLSTLSLLRTTDPASGRVITWAAVTFDSFGAPLLGNLTHQNDLKLDQPDITVELRSKEGGAHWDLSGSWAPGGSSPAFDSL